MNSSRPLDGLGSIKIKLGLLVGVSCVVAALISAIGDRAGLPLWLTIPVTVAAATLVTQWLARGMTAPLREMTTAATAMASGDYSQRVVSTSTDEVGALARAFNAMASDLGEVDRQRRELIATVSHELRTPLAAQRAVLDNLVDGVVAPNARTLRGVLTQSERLSDLVSDLLDLSRIDAGVAPLRLGKVEVQQVVTEAIAEAELHAPHVSFVCRVAPPTLTVTADGARLAQVITNLLDNAIKHSPPHGEVRVAADVVDDETWSLTVSDDGPGIPAEHATKVMGRFWGTDTKGGGTGLGLAIAAWVCELHGGRLSVDTTTSTTTEREHPGAVLRAVLPRHTTSRPPKTLDRPTHPNPTEATMATTPTPHAMAGSHPLVGATPTAEPHQAGAASPTIERIFGTLWPERQLPPQPLLLCGSLVIGALAAILLPESRIGVGAGVVSMLTAALMTRASTQARSRWGVACIAVGVGLTAMTAVRASEWIAVMSAFAAALLLAAALTGARSVLSIPASAAAWVLSGVRGLPLLGRTVSATSRVPLLWPVLRTAALAAIALVLFGGLFASGDAIFGSWAASLVPDLSWDSIIARVFVFVFVGGVTLAGTYLALNPPAIADLRLPEAPRTRRRWEWLVPLVVVIAVYATFLLAQSAAMWGGHEYLRRTTGLTYAEYVHQGFGQLTVATLLTLAVVALTMWWAAVETPGDRRALQVSLGVLCLLTLAVVGSALYRMSLYQEAYGYTVLRVLVDGFELWLGLLVMLTLVSVVRLRAGWLPRAALLSGAVFVLGFGLMNPGGWVADRNIDRYERTGKLDAPYLATLGDDALPTIVARLDRRTLSCVGLNDRPEPRNADTIASWNLARSRADAVAVPDLPRDVAHCASLTGP